MLLQRIIHKILMLLQQKQHRSRKSCDAIIMISHRSATELGPATTGVAGPSVAETFHINEN